MQNLNIGQKIFSVALVVLILMLAVAAFSVQKTAEISDALETVAERQLPIADAVTRINVRVLEQGVILERLFVIAEETVDHAAASATGRNRLQEHAEAVEREFATSRNLLNIDARAVKPGSPLAITIETLSADLDAIEREYRNFQQHAELLLNAREAGDANEFARLLSQLSTRQDAIYAEIANLRRDVEQLTSDAVIRADKDERFLLVANSSLTVIAAVFGLGLALLITRALVASVQRLVHGTEQVEAGNLDTEVPVSTADEIGRLTASFNGMVDGLRLKERIKDTFGKYVDPRIVSNLLDRPEFAEPGGEKREMTVMFIDLKGFTSISEVLPPDQLVHTINAFFTHMTKAISDNNGVVDKFMGDAVMAYWGPPFTGPDEHAALACKTAASALEHLKNFRDEVAAEVGADTVEIDLRIGVSTGEMVVGTIGSTTSRSFTVMGDPVNLGSRLEGANKAYGTHTMISERTRELAGDVIVVRELDLIRVKGKHEPTRVYELTGLQGDARALPAPNAERFGQGLLAYRNQDWDEAATAFNACLSETPNDPPCEVYLSRIEQLRSSPPGPDWDGVWVFDTK